MINPVLLPETETRLRSLVEKMLEVNKTMNLTSIRDPNDAWNKHILDSLQGLETELFDENQSVVDVGSGAGFPGLPLAIAVKGMRVSLMDATGKKCRYLAQMNEEFGLKGEVINLRAEEAGHDPKYRQKFDIAIARAVGGFVEVAEYCLPLVKLGGHVVLWRGKDAEIEARNSEEALDELGGFLKDIVPYQIPGHEMTYYLVSIEKQNATPRNYPRSSGLPKKKPLDQILY